MSTPTKEELEARLRELEDGLQRYAESVRVLEVRLAETVPKLLRLTEYMQRHIDELESKP